jgi:hypothetical protein
MLCLWVNSSRRFEAPQNLRIHVEAVQDKRLLGHKGGHITILRIVVNYLPNDTT